VAVQLVAFAEDQARVVDCPAVITAGVAVKATVGAGTETVTVTDLAVVPPDPVHVSV
jgi:hypothetical protein